MPLYTELRRKLAAVASGQHGYFTARQAKACGYQDEVHGYHVRAGNWVRVHRGVYRLSFYPDHPHDHLVRWSLWSCGRDGVPQGTYAHGTALAVHEDRPLEAINDLHMIVPPGFRRNSPTPPGLILHKAALSEEDIEIRDGFRITSRTRTRLDLAGARIAPAAAASHAVNDWAVWSS
jgi:hypothetical protein